MSYVDDLDEPSTLAPLAEWRRFLLFAERLPMDDDGVRLARNSACRRIRQLEKIGTEVPAR